MKKQKTEGTDLVKSLHANERKTRNEKFMSSDPIVFIKKLVSTVFALAILGLGVAAAIYGQSLNNGFKLAVLVSAACAIVDGVYLLYTALMKIK